jgi:hypothetical protein
MAEKEETSNPGVPKGSAPWKRWTVPAAGTTVRPRQHGVTASKAKGDVCDVPRNDWRTSGLDAGEKFTVRFDAAGHPVMRTVRKMTPDEMDAAVERLATASKGGDDKAGDQLRRLLQLVGTWGPASVFGYGIMQECRISPIQGFSAPDLVDDLNASFGRAALRATAQSVPSDAQMKAVTRAERAATNHAKALDALLKVAGEEIDRRQVALDRDGALKSAQTLKNTRDAMKTRQKNGAYYPRLDGEPRDGWGWLFAVELPRLFEKYTGKKRTFVEATKDTPEPSPCVRFIQAVLKVVRNEPCSAARIIQTKQRYEKSQHAGTRSDIAPPAAASPSLDTDSS